MQRVAEAWHLKISALLVFVSVVALFLLRHISFGDAEIVKWLAVAMFAVAVGVALYGQFSDAARDRRAKMLDDNLDAALPRAEQASEKARALNKREHSEKHGSP